MIKTMLLVFTFALVSIGIANAMPQTPPTHTAIYSTSDAQQIAVQSFQALQADNTQADASATNTSAIKDAKTKNAKLPKVIWGKQNIPTPHLSFSVPRIQMPHVTATKAPHATIVKIVNKVISFKAVKLHDVKFKAN